MAETLKDFLVSIGFKVDEASQKASEASVAQSEAKLTAATVRELERRRAAEDKMLSDRVNAIVATGGELDAEEKAAASRFLKTQQEAADKQKRLDEEATKRTRERREKGWKDAQALILGFAALAAKAAVAVEAAALGVVYATDKAAKGFEQLGYAAQRIGAAPKSINAFTYAASQLGSSVGEAQGSLEKFGENLRRLPGFAGYIESLGVRTKDAKGQMRDAADIATDLGAALGKIRNADPKYGYTNAIARAANLGFDENTTRALMDPAFPKREAQYKADQAKIGADPNAAASAGTAFEQSMRHLEEVAGAVATKIDTDLFKKIQPLLDKLADWMAAHGDQIATLVSRIADDLVRLATAMGDAFAKVDWDGALTKAEHFFEEFDKKAREYFGKDGLTAVFEAFGLVLAVSVLGRLRAMISALSTLSGIPLFTRLLTLLGVGGSVGIAAAAAGAMAESTPGAGVSGDATVRAGQTAENQQLTDDWNKAHGQGKGFWKDTWGYVKKKLGFGGGDETHVSSAGPRSRGIGANFNKENADAIVSAAKQLGTTPEDLATVIGYETGGTFSPSKWGGKGGNYMGLIQFGPSERAQYGADEGQMFPEQMGAVVRYLKGRGFKPGMGLKDLYSTINAGSPGHYGASDGNGTVASHVEKMQGATAAQARALLALATPPTSGDVQVANGSSSAPALKSSTSDPMTRSPTAARLATNFGSLIGIGSASAAERPRNPFGGLDPNAFKTAPLGPSVSSMYQSYDNSRTRGDTTINAPQTFNIQGGDVRSNLAAARMAAGRGNPDWVRNLQSAEQ